MNRKLLACRDSASQSSYFPELVRLYALRLRFPCVLLVFQILHCQGHFGTRLMAPPILQSLIELGVLQGFKQPADVWLDYATVPIKK